MPEVGRCQTTRQWTEEEEAARRWYNIALEQQQQIQTQHESAVQLAAQLQHRLEQERNRYVSDSQQAKAILEGAAATTQSCQMSNAQLREQAEFEVQAAQARSNTEVREMAQKFEALETKRITRSPKSIAAGNCC